MLSELDNIINQKLKENLKKKTYTVVCPNCHQMFSAVSGEIVCPNCQKTVKINLNLNF